MPPVRGACGTWDHHITVFNTKLGYWGVGVLLGLVSSVFVNTWCCSMLLWCGARRLPKYTSKPSSWFFFVFLLYSRCVESWCLEVMNQHHPLFITVSWEDWNDSSFQSSFPGWTVSPWLSWVLTGWMCRAPTEPWQPWDWCWLACTQVSTFFKLLMCWETGLLTVLIFLIYCCYQE